MLANLARVLGDEELIGQLSGAGQLAIFRVHAEFFKGDELIDETVKEIKAGYSACWAWREVIQERVEAMSKVEDEVIVGRALDLNDVGTWVLKLLAGVVDDEPFLPEEPVILVAEDLTPSDTARLGPANLLGFCTAGGGPTSHTAVIARSLNIPAAVGAGPAVLNLTDGLSSRARFRRTGPAGSRGWPGEPTACTRLCSGWWPRPYRPQPKPARQEIKL